MVKKVGIVILNYKVRDQTINCLQSVKRSKWQNSEIFVIDNDSKDGLEEEVKKFPDVSFVQTGHNLGYTGANNIGITLALDKKVDFIFILNADTEIDAKCIDFCVEAMENPTVGIVAPKILFEDKKTIWFAGGWLDKANVLGFHRGVDEIDRGQYDTIEEIDNCTGGALFTRKEVFEKVGLFDERYFLYYEDSDFCYRVKNAGFKIMYMPKAIVYHANAQSTGLGSPLQDYYITRNRMLFASKFLPLRTQFALIREAIRNFSIPVRRAAFFDFLSRRFGKGKYKFS